MMKMMTLKRTILITSFISIAQGCANNPAPVNKFTLWGHELAHCVHGYYHNADYTEYDFSKTFQSTNKVEVVPYKNRKEVEALHLEHKRVAMSKDNGAFFRRAGDTCYIYVPDLGEY